QDAPESILERSVGTKKAGGEPAFSLFLEPGFQFPSIHTCERSWCFVLCTWVTGTWGLRSLAFFLTFTRRLILFELFSCFRRWTLWVCGFASSLRKEKP